MNMTPQGYSLHAIQGEVAYRVVGWSIADDGTLAPVVVKQDAGTAPRVLVGPVFYFEPTGCLCGS